ncbi:MAG: hypothetical protein ABIJ92_03205 [Candidatus Aenigmatarchaeota archaeon]
MVLAFLTSITGIGIFIVCQIIFLQRKKQDFRSSLYILLIGLSFLFSSYAVFMDFVGFGFPLIVQLKAIHVLFLAVMITLLISRISDMGRLNYLLSILIVPVISFFFNFPWEVLTFILASYVMGMAFFILFLLSTRRIRHAGLFGLAFVIINVALLIFVGFNSMLSTTFFSEIFLIVSLLYFIKFGLEFDHLVRPYKFGFFRNRKEIRGVWKSFGYLMIYIVTLNIALILAGIALHELGHLFIGYLFGCEGGIVLMNIPPAFPGPYTELSCALPVQEMILAESGFLFIIPFGLTFLLLKRFPEKNFAYVILGLAIILGSLDMLLAIPNHYTPYVAVFIGMFLMSLGEMFLIFDYTSHPRIQEIRKRKRLKNPTRREVIYEEYEEETESI